MSNNANYRVLIVDDEPDILEFISYNLKKEGYEVYVNNNGRDAIQTAKRVHPHLILLDVMMPDLDGIETCRIIREDNSLKDTIIAFLTARNEDYSQIAGFDAGADDYINKPIKPRVLTSRLQALLRRLNGDDKSGQIDVAGLSINREKYLVTQDGVEHNLPRKEFELLSLLASKPGKVFTRDDILKQVWGGQVVVGDRTIDVHIRKLREKFGEDCIKTVKGVGYKFEF
jgi:two-component system alkaline phosphatase synthesis response regulator PhoP